MQTALRYALPIVFGLALFTLGSYLVVSTTSRSWFEDDVRRRAELAIRGAGDALSQSWARGDRVSVRRVLDDITRDERILAAAACAPDGSLHGTAGLYVADASLFPTALGVNPMMTIIAFAKQVAREVAGSSFSSSSYSPQVAH